MRFNISIAFVAGLFISGCSVFDRFDRSEPGLFAAKPAGVSVDGPLQAAGLSHDEYGRVKTHDDIIFNPRSSALPSEADYAVTDAAQFLFKRKHSVARIEGHTDASGKEQANLDLSVQRAFAVRNALIAAGIEAHRLEPVGLGETRPVASNETPDGRKANRRVSIYFLQ